MTGRGGGRCCPTTWTISTETVELLVYAVTVALAGGLLRPVLRRLPVPGWLERARRRGRPGVPVTAWLGCLIGERRGLAGALLFGLWVLAPVAAAWITSFWLRRPTPS
jgi:hypothetical protein